MLFSLLNHFIQSIFLAFNPKKKIFRQQSDNTYWLSKKITLIPDTPDHPEISAVEFPRVGLSHPKYKHCLFIGRTFEIL
jgi:hypothetical protein